MKKIKFNIIIAIVLLAGCAQMPFEELYLDPIRQKSVVIIPSDESCNYITSIKSIPIWNKPKPDSYLSSLRYLKKRAYKKNGNAISQIRMTDKEYPYSEANVYQCPQEIFDKYIPLQDDKEYLYSNIKFDLPKPKTDEEEPK